MRLWAAGGLRRDDWGGSGALLSPGDSEGRVGILSERTTSMSQLREEKGTAHHSKTRRNRLQIGFLSASPFYIGADSNAGAAAADPAGLQHLQEQELKREPSSRTLTVHHNAAGTAPSTPQSLATQFSQIRAPALRQHASTALAIK